MPVDPNAAGGYEDFPPPTEAKALEPAAAPAPAFEDFPPPSEAKALDPNEEPAWLKAAEWTVPPAMMYGGEAAGAAVGAMTGPVAPLAAPALATAGAGVGNLLSDEALDQMRKFAGVPRKNIDPSMSLATGVGGSILGKMAAPVAGGLAKVIAGAPSEKAIIDAGEEGAQSTLGKIDPITGAQAMGPLRQAAGDLATETGGVGVRESLGIGPASTNNILSEPAALEHVGAQDSALQPVGRLFEKKGKAIGDLLEPFKDVDAPTTALADSAHMVEGAEGANIFGGTIGAEVRKNGMQVSPSAQKMFQEAAQMGENGTEKIGVILGKLNTIQGMLAKPNLGQGDRYVLSELRDQYLNVAGSSQNIPQSVQNALKGPRAEYRTLKDYYKGFYGVGATTSPAETGEFLWKQNPRALSTMLDEATPEETNHLTNATGQYITGDGKNTGAETVKRFSELKKQNPDALKKMFGTGPFSEASTWADLPKMQAALLDGIKDPKLQGAYVKGWQQGTLNTPEAQALAQARDKFLSLPKPEQARRAAQLQYISTPEGARSIIGGQRFFLARMVLFAPMGIGVAAHHPEVAAGLGALYAAHEGMAAAIRNNPEMYLDMLRAANSKTAQGLYRAGYFASRIAMYDSAAALERHFASNEEEPAAAPAPAAEPTP